MELTLPEALVGGFLRRVVKPVLGPPFPIRFQRGWLEAASVFGAPRGVTQTRSELGGVGVLRFTGATGAGPVVLYFHGGGFIVSSPRTHAALCGSLASACGGVVHSVDYRLAPEHPWPAGRDDALAAYDALVASGTEPGRIVLGGDSAGGVMVVDLVRDILAGDRPKPAAAVLLSPAVGFDRLGNATGAGKKDTIVSPRWAPVVDAAYARPVSEPGHRILGTDLHGFPPVYLQFSRDEVFGADNRVFAEDLRRCGVQVEVHEDAGSFHVLPLLPGVMRRARLAVLDIAAFSRRVVGDE